MRYPQPLIAMLTAALSLALPAGAFAASENGDAGELPGTAQDLTSAPVDAIDGSIGGDSDQDLYRVCLEGGGGFSATTVGGSELDTQLFLFDANGLGVYANDDSQATRQSTLPALDPRTPAAPGVYLLAVTPYDRDPRSPAGAIFPARRRSARADRTGRVAAAVGVGRPRRPAGRLPHRPHRHRGLRAPGHHAAHGGPHRCPRTAPRCRAGRDRERGLQLRRRGRLGPGLLRGQRGERRRRSTPRRSGRAPSRSRRATTPATRRS